MYPIILIAWEFTEKAQSKYTSVYSIRTCNIGRSDNIIHRTILLLSEKFSRWNGSIIRIRFQIWNRFKIFSILYNKIYFFRWNNISIEFNGIRLSFLKRLKIWSDLLYRIFLFMKNIKSYIQVAIMWEWWKYFDYLYVNINILLW